MGLRSLHQKGDCFHRNGHFGTISSGLFRHFAMDAMWWSLLERVLEKPKPSFCRFWATSFMKLATGPHAVRDRQIHGGKVLQAGSLNARANHARPRSEL